MLIRTVALCLVLIGVPSAAWSDDAPVWPPPGSNIELAPDETEVVVEDEAEDTDDDERYAPLLDFELGPLGLTIPFSISERIEFIGGFPIDTNGNQYNADPAFVGQFTVGARLDSKELTSLGHFVIDYEHQIYTGVQAGGVADDPLFALDQPNADRDPETHLRKLSLTLDVGQDVHFLAGFTTSLWGMGLLANDGHHGWEPGNARFGDPIEGDRVLRAMGIVGPIAESGIVVGLGADRVEGDDVMREGDEANQFVGFIMAGPGQPNHLGAYMVMRRQTAEDGSFLNVQAADLAGGYRFDFEGGNHLTLRAEAALIWGETSLGPSADFPVHDVLQMGGALQAAADFGKAGFVFDVVFASGDNNTDDEQQNGFKADSNYHVGLLLYRFVGGAQSGRSSITAFDPDLVGYAAEDLDRIPTRGSVSNTIGIFPRGFWRPVEGLEIYGGPLFAFAATDPVDAFHTRIAGGDPRNSLNGDPGSYYGTELDIGVRYRRLIAGTELTVGLEGGLLLPGDALVDADGTKMESVTGSRFSLQYRF